MVLQVMFTQIRFEDTNIIDFGEAGRTAGFDSAYISEFRSMMQAFSFIRKMRKEGKSRFDMVEIISFRQMIELVKFYEENYEQLYHSTIDNENNSPQSYIALKCIGYFVNQKN